MVRLSLLVVGLLACSASASLLDPSDWVDELSHGAGGVQSCRGVDGSLPEAEERAKEPRRGGSGRLPPAVARTRCPASALGFCFHAIIHPPCCTALAGVEKWKKPDFCGCVRRVACAVVRRRAAHAAWQAPFRTHSQQAILSVRRLCRRKMDCPPFRVKKRTDNYEVRKYDAGGTRAWGRAACSVSRQPAQRGLHASSLPAVLQESGRACFALPLQASGSSQM